MPYMLLIIEPPGQRRTRTLAEGEQVYERMLRFGAGLRERGLLLASESLESQAGAARVELRGGRRSVLDGPFAEAKEMVGGFFLVDCRTRDEAIANRGRMPGRRMVQRRGARARALL